MYQNICLHLSSFDVLTSDFVDIATKSPHEGGSLIGVFVFVPGVGCEPNQGALHQGLGDFRMFNGFDKISFSKQFFFEKEVSMLGRFIYESHFVFSHLGKANPTEMKSNHMLDSPIVLLRSFGTVIYTCIYCDCI